MRFLEKMSDMVPEINDFIKGQKALVIDDEVAIAQLLKIHLTQLGFETEVVHSAEAAFTLLQSSTYKICLLDWMLPGLQGVDFLKRIRPKYPNLKIMMVTAKADAESLVVGIESGADDYLSKPFDFKVLVARVRNLMRRLQFEESKQNQSTEISHQNGMVLLDKVMFDELSINFTKHVVKYKNSTIHLTPSEFKLLEALFKAQGSVLTREQLMALIQGHDVSVTARTIDTHVFALRKKIGNWSKNIETIRGVGYRILISDEDLSEEVL